MRWMAVWMTGCSLGAGDGQTCDEVAHEVYQTLTDVASANHSCTVTDDCEIVWLSVTCSQSCSTVVGIGGVEVFEAARDEAENGICADHPSCEPPAPPCVPPGPVDCVEGACVEL